MEIKNIVEDLRNKGDALSIQAADTLAELKDKYDELGRVYDALSSDLIRVYKRLERIQSEVINKQK